MLPLMSALEVVDRALVVMLNSSLKLKPPAAAAAAAAVDRSSRAHSALVSTLQLLLLAVQPSSPDPPSLASRLRSSASSHRLARR